MTGAVSTLLQRAGEWLLEPPPQAPAAAAPALESLAPPPPGPAAAAPAHALAPPPERTYPLLGVVGLAHRCGATTVARALAVQLAVAEDRPAVVASQERPRPIALASAASARRLAGALPELGDARAVGRICLASCPDPARAAAATRAVAPAVVEIEPGTPAVDAAPLVDRMVLVASPRLEPALAAALAETIAAVAEPPVIAVNRAPDHGTWLTRADVLVPDSRIGARLALAGREPGGWLGRSIEQLADLCGGG
jgi:hypothetical protein